MSRPTPLDVIFPRPVFVKLAGKYYRAGPLTLGDLATLQSWLRQAAGDPVRDLSPPLLDRQPATRRRRLVEAWRALKEWPPIVGSDADGTWLNSPEGRAVFLVLVLGRYEDEFKAEDAEDLTERMSPDDWSRLRRLAWGVPAWREIAAELDPVWLDRQIAGSGEGTNWAESVISVMRHGHYTFEEIEEWTPAQLALYCSEGKQSEYRAIRQPHESKEAFEARIADTFRVPEDETCTDTVTPSV